MNNKHMGLCVLASRSHSNCQSTHGRAGALVDLPAVFSGGPGDKMCDKMWENLFLS